MKKKAKLETLRCRQGGALILLVGLLLNIFVFAKWLFNGDDSFVVVFIQYLLFYFFTMVLYLMIGAGLGYVWFKVFDDI